ncbi:MAG: prolipoprotein diacylglyceryl transferase [Alphaproteobacteria bacterium]|nr:prolipoprotein diacylglyceryl transferase [Alphaproteobacteria bacterium]
MLEFPRIDPVALHIGPLLIRWYALAYLGGILLGWAYADRLVRKPALWPQGKAPCTPDQISDFVTWVTLGIILGGRLGYVLFYNAQYYLFNPLEILKVWQGGMSFHGGLIGVLLAIVIFTRRNSLTAGSFADLIASVVPIGLLLGRLANFINGELWGRVTTAPAGMVFPDGGPLPRHPSQLYEAGLEGLALLLLLFVAGQYWRGLSRPWLITGLFGICYGAARIFAEIFREPDAQIGFLTGGVTMGMVLSLPLLLGGAALMTVALRKRTA